MSLTATFLGGAKSRLLPASIPFRYFAAAALFHCLSWGMLLAGASDLVGFQGGLGRPVAAIHLLTIGVLAMTAMGAAFQLLPVATVQPLGRLWPARLAFWLAVPGLLALSYGLTTGAMGALAAGAVGVAAGLLLFAGAIADNLWRARSLPVVAAHGWAALASLLAILALGALLSFDFSLGLLDDHQAVALAHFLLTAFGFMGLLALGFSYVLVPMFALSPAPSPRLAWTSLALGVVGLLLALAGVLLGKALLQALAGVAGLGAAGVHLEVMRRAWLKRMRRRMGLSFVLVRVGWAMLVVSLALGLALALGVQVPGGVALFGFVVLVGWLLTFLLGILQRILPFLASMHAGKGARRPPLVSELTPDLPLKVHAVCHLAAMALIATGLAADAAWPVRLGALGGLAGSLAFGAFTFEVLRRLSGPSR